MKEKIKLSKYPKYLILGLVAAFRKDPAGFFLSIGIGGSVLAAPILAIPIYLFIPGGPVHVGMHIFISLLLGMACWIILIALFAACFILVPTVFRGLMEVIEDGEREEYKIIEMLKRKSNND